jgi:hypothetical protein
MSVSLASRTFWSGDTTCLVCEEQCHGAWELGFQTADCLGQVCWCCYERIWSLCSNTRHLSFHVWCERDLAPAAPPAPLLATDNELVAPAALVGLWSRGRQEREARGQALREAEYKDYLWRRQMEAEVALVEQERSRRNRGLPML